MTLKQAKQQFPIGTKFIPAHLHRSDHLFSIVTNSNIIEDSKGNIISLTDENEQSAKGLGLTRDGNHIFVRVIYYAEENKVASILEKPKNQIYEIW